MYDDDLGRNSVKTVLWRATLVLLKIILKGQVTCRISNAKIRSRAE